MQLGDVLKKDDSQGVSWTTADSASRCCHIRQFSINLRVIACVLFYVKQFCMLIKVNQWRCQLASDGMSLLTFHPLTHAFL